MFYFIESSFPAFLSNYLKSGGLFFYTRESIKFAPSNQNAIVVKSFLLYKILKIISGVLQINSTFQGGGLAYKLSFKKSVISDGILTEILVKNGLLRPKNYISFNVIKPSVQVSIGNQIILGNNFYEFGNMTYSTYKKYLMFMYEKFPDAYYFPHPKESSSLLEVFFSNRVIRFNGNIEAYCHANGVPQNIISFIGSTAVASLTLMANSNINVYALFLEPSDFDGPLGNVTDPQLLDKKDIKITVQLLENVVLEILENNPNVTINRESIKF